MTRLSARDKHTVACHREWSVWGEQFGWRMYGSNDDLAATFIDDQGEFISITAAIRAAMDRAIAKRG